MPPAARSHRHPENPFRGFEPLTANFVYCPNQFFDVCLPYNSRGVVRLVAYLIRQSLGFRDADGNPIRQNISIPFQDFVDKAHISRGAIGPTIKEAIEKNFISCTQQAKPKSQGTASVSGAYALKWGTDQTYTANPSLFDGFYTGPGCRTPIPNSFFDQIIANETLAVTKIVGAVLRHTVGYETQFGRREQVDLSYTSLQNFVKIRDRKTVADAIKYSLDRQYIRRIKEGKFSSDQAQRSTARYGVKWLDTHKKQGNGSKTQPAIDQFNNPTKNGSRNQPSDQFKNPTSLKTQLKNKNNKQPTVAVDSKVFDLLKEWFDRDTIGRLLEQASPDEIENQVQWLTYRKPSNNPAGMLRRAIEESWSAPPNVELEKQRQKTALRQSKNLQAVQQKADAENDTTLRRKEERLALLAQWNSLPVDSQQSAREAAIESAKSEAIKRILQRNADLSDPHWFVLKQLQK